MGWATEAATDGNGEDGDDDEGEATRRPEYLKQSVRSWRATGKLPKFQMGSRDRPAINRTYPSVGQSAPARGLRRVAAGPGE